MTLRLTLFIAAALIVQTGFAQLFGEQQIVSTGTYIEQNIDKADLDADGDLDVLWVSVYDYKILWCENLGDGSFGAQQIISANDEYYPLSVHSADIDADGDMDVVSGEDNKLGVHRNLGNGNFVYEPVNFTIGTDAVYALFVASGDLDGDGDIDLVTFDENDGFDGMPVGMVWWKNNGFGEFGFEQYFNDIAYSVSEIVAADLDGDSAIDLLICSNSGDYIAWFKNLGNGNFGAQQIISTQTNGATSLKAGDMDGDGDLDLISASFNDDKIAWYENLGGGSFGAQQIISTQIDRPNAVFIADLDGDEDLDILSSSAWNNKIAWFENLDEGQFGSEQIISSQTPGARSVIAADLDGDMALDVLAAAVDKIVWHQNLSAGCTDPYACNYAPAALINNGSCCYNNCDSQFGAGVDLDSDGFTNCAGDCNDNNSAIHPGAQEICNGIDDDCDNLIDEDFDMDGDGFTHCGGDCNDNNSAVYPGAIEICNDIDDDCDNLIDEGFDADGDGYTNCGGDCNDNDALVNPDVPGACNAYNPQLFGDLQIVNPQMWSSLVIDGYSADLDGDNDMDLISGIQGTQQQVAINLNLGEGQFDARQTITEDVSLIWTVHAADLDGDTDMDILSGSGSDDKVAWYENLGGGLFGTQQIITTLANSVYSVYAADLDGDGDMDVLSASGADNKIAWYRNLGGGVFGPQQVLTTQASIALSVHAADMDGDGDMDVLSASGADDEIAWHRNLGGGVFANRQIISTQGNGATYVDAADLDNDGDLDIIAASQLDNKVAWYKNLGGGSFGSEQIITTQAADARCVSAADLDFDGDIDILSSSVGDDKLAWYANLGSGSFGIQQVISNAVGGVFVQATDLDGDGDLDVLSSSSGDDGLVWFENLLTGLGCTDSNACNYQPDAWIDNGSCCFTNCGCTNPAAANYSESASCDNGSCEFLISGTVFFDENENGVMDGAEYGLPFQTVVIEGLNQTYITNDEGIFIADIGAEQMAQFELINSSVFPNNTTENPQLLNTENAESYNLFFGVSNEEPDFAISINLYPSGNTFLCNAYSNHNICFRNMGNVPIDGILELEYDQLFQGHQEVTPIDSVNGNRVYMSFENLLPGQMLFYDINLITPTVDHIGEFVTSNARIYGYNEGNQVAYGEMELTMEITCAYDPNDKQAFPLGYTDEHWLLQETEQEFLIRFQNTGNAPAQDVRIQDTLDVNFDIESFRLISNSHSVMTKIDPETRIIEFYFENIQLPDSVNNEPESHGFISYKITPLPGLPVGTVLENTAYIYFDNNDPIITNTTWTTIHECGGEAAFEVSATEICAGETINFSGTYPHVESHQWSLNSAPESTEQSFSKTFDEAGVYTVQLEAENPLCYATSSQTITVHELPALEVSSSDSEICSGGSIEISVVGENVAINSWVHDNEWITQDSIWVQEFASPGVFTIALSAENALCSNTNEINITVHENPSANFSTSATAICAGESITLDATGNTSDTYSWTINDEIIGDQQSIVHAFDVAGEYTVALNTQNEYCSATQTQIVAIHENPSANFSMSATAICAGENITLNAIGNTGDTYSWTINDEIIGDQQSIVQAFDVAGEYTVALNIQNDNCSATQTQIVVVHENPSANFSTSATAICAGESTTLNATGNTSVTYSWTLNDEIIGDQQSIVQAFDVAGEYAVTLNTQNENCSATQTQIVVVHENPLANFSTSATAICAGENITLDATGSTSDTYSWTINEEIIGDQQSIVQAFDVAGENTVALNIQNDNCSATQTQIVVVHENPSANFSTSATAICAGENITLDATGSTSVTYSWTINDEIIGDQQSIVQAFDVAGEYAVTLNTQNDNCSATQTQIVVVHENPSANFSTSATAICAGENITLDATGSTSDTYSWTINNEIIGDQQSIVHAFDVPGEYTVALNTQNEYCSATQTQIVVVHENPSANFSTSATAICAGENITLNATGNTSVTYSWTINDEIIGDQQSIVHAFDVAGEYTVALNTQNENCSATQTQIVAIHENPSANFSTSATAICAGENITLNATGNTGDTYSWTINNEIIGDQQSIVQAFDVAGEYTVALNIQNDNCSATQTQIVVVHENPSANFSTSATAICAGESITLNATGNTSVTYSWTINDEIIGDQQSIVHAFDVAGEYTVALNTQNEYCSATQTQIVVVFPNPTVAFTHDSDLLTASAGEAYQWYMNGVAIIGATAQQYAITDDGLYSVEVTNEFNCTSISDEIMIIGVLNVDSETILLYPNPMTERAYLEFEDSATRTVILLDESGKEVRIYQSVNTKRLEITKANLAAGNYVVTVQQHNGKMHSLRLLVK